MHTSLNLYGEGLHDGSIVDGFLHKCLNVFVRPKSPTGNSYNKERHETYVLMSVLTEESANTFRGTGSWNMHLTPEWYADTNIAYAPSESINAPSSSLNILPIFLLKDSFAMLFLSFQLSCLSKATAKIQLFFHSATTIFAPPPKTSSSGHYL